MIELPNFSSVFLTLNCCTSCGQAPEDLSLAGAGGRPQEEVQALAEHARGQEGGRQGARDGIEEAGLECPPCTVESDG